MAHLDHSDLERQANIDLTTPNGEALAQALINAAIAWAQNCCGYTFAKAAFVGFVDDGVRQYFLETAVPSRTPSKSQSASAGGTSTIGEPMTPAGASSRSIRSTKPSVA